MRGGQRGFRYAFKPENSARYSRLNQTLSRAVLLLLLSMHAMALQDRGLLMRLAVS
jgi:hypothetical protein